MSLGLVNVPKTSGPHGEPKVPARLAPRERKFLPEVQGLRALAVLMVVSYHVWFGRISGGVDIFLLISAFLLTGQFTRKLESGRPLGLLKYWVHLFKRLLPLIAVTLVATLVGAYFLIPEARWHSIIGQSWASLLYYQNWFLAAESVDYYATDHSLASPLQHFWSLSIQGQIFIIWPLVFAVAALIARRSKLRVRPLLMCMFGAVFVVSLLFSIITTHTNQAFAYFDTRTRLWEFALGSLLALVLPYVRLRRNTRIVLGWVGIVGMLSCGLILQVGQQFPGYMALWPTLSAAFIIVAGFTDSKAGVDRFLSWKPLVSLGNSSYALYLFHWPLLVFVLVVTGRDHAGPKAGLAIIVVSIVAAYLATRWIDIPLRRNKWFDLKLRRAAVVIAVCIAVVAAPLAGWQHQIQAKEQAALAQAESNNPGAEALRPGFVPQGDPAAPMQPALTALDKQWVSLDKKCEGDLATTGAVLAKSCTQSSPTGTPSKTIVVVGDSHAEQWMGALIPVAEENNWQLVSVLLGGCDFGDEAEDSGRESSCVDFNVAAQDYILDQQPDAVFTIATNAVPDSPSENVVAGYETAVKTFTGAGIDVVGMRDNPRFLANVASCVSAQGADACSFQKDNNLAPENPAESLNSIKGAYMLDLTDSLCTDGSCDAVIGNTLVYMDNNHLTGVYAKSMAPDMEEHLFAATGWKRG
ncbi:acyltransferase family protein [Arthrobacter sp. TWP1-1]|uniref:acyltransferase family protein n=1 Tax=Arthrobacter sp. TWP1-1 TaxID=2804568 RepID=UPI003CE7247C